MSPEQKAQIGNARLANQLGQMQIQLTVQQVEIESLSQELQASRDANASLQAQVDTYAPKKDDPNAPTSRQDEKPTGIAAAGAAPKKGDK